LHPIARMNAAGDGEGQVKPLCARCGLSYVLRIGRDTTGGRARIGSGERPFALWAPRIAVKRFVYAESKPMPPLYKPRVGWEGERLAHYLLSRFSFVAQPTTIADDAGSDFFCTLFEIVDSKPKTVEARASFAIQIKSNGKKIAAHNKVRYLFNLEIPYFLGVVSQRKAELKIYSAERFPMMTAVFGLRKKLWLRPVEEDGPFWDGEANPDGVTLNCYPVCTFTAAEGRDELREKVDQMVKLCRRAVNNIGTRRIEEHIYQMDNAAKNFQIVAGCGSVNFFRDNIYRRLAEAFYNFEYMLRNDPPLFNLAEFRIYEAFHLAVVAANPQESLQLAHNMYMRIRAILEQRLPSPHAPF
jgi:hypothetical protein